MRALCDAARGVIGLSRLRRFERHRPAVLQRLRAGTGCAARTPKHLAEKILALAAALEGERKQVTVLFADVKGSMELAEQLDPEEWHRILERFFAILAEGVHRFEGTVEPVHRRRHHGAVRRADRARGPRAARLLRGAPPARRARAATPTSCSASTASASRCAWASTRARSWSARSATTCAWTTRRRATPSASRSAWSSSPTPDTCYLTRAHGRAGRRLFRARATSVSFEVKGVEPRRCGSTSWRRRRLHARGSTSRAARGFSRFVGRSRRDGARSRRPRAEPRRATGRWSAWWPRRAPGRAASASSSSSAAARAASPVYEARGVAHGASVPFLPDPRAVPRLLRHHRAGRRPDGAREDRRAHAAARRELRRRRCRCSSTSSACPIPERPVPRIDPEARQRQLIGVIAAHPRAERPRSRGDQPLRGPALARRRERGVPRSTSRPAGTGACCS